MQVFQITIRIQLPFNSLVGEYVRVSKITEINNMMTSSNGNIFRVTGHLCGRSPVNSLHKGQWRGALMFSLICVWINDWVNNREAGDLRRHRGHYDVNVMKSDEFSRIYRKRNNNLLNTGGVLDHRLGPARPFFFWAAFITLFHAPQNNRRIGLFFALLHQIWIFPDRKMEMWRFCLGFWHTDYLFHNTLSYFQTRNGGY